MKILILHHTDLDGAGSAAVVGMYHQGEDITYKAHNYGWPLSPEDLKGYDRIYAVDISFGQDHPWVYSVPGLVWIDHHKAALEYENAHPDLFRIPGLRAIGKGACELTWGYLFPDYQTPELIQILSTYDVWDKGRMDWDWVVMVETGAKHVLGISPQAIIDFIQTGRHPSELLAVGKTILGYLEKSGKGRLIGGGFWIPEFHGYRCIALNTQEFSSLAFMSLMDPGKVDICMPFQIFPSENTPGEMYVRCSLYTENPGIDVSQIAGTYGGGGHRGSAGFQISMGELSGILSAGVSLKKLLKETNWKPLPRKYY